VRAGIRIITIITTTSRARGGLSSEEFQTLLLARWRGKRRRVFYLRGHFWLGL